MKKSFPFVAGFLLLFSLSAVSQSVLHRVLVLNEGHFDYVTMQQDVPVTVGAYDPQTSQYATVITVPGARFASDMLLDAGNLYVADYNNSRVVGLNSSLVYTGSFDGSTGTAFDSIFGIAADSDGNLLVSDSANSNVQKFTPSGAFLKSLGNTAASVTFSEPYFLATDSGKKVYVVDSNNEQIDIFNPY